MSTLAVKNVINITLGGVPSGLQEPNVNILGLFTTETNGTPSVYDDFISATDVGTSYGTSSVTYNMAVAIFAQKLNILSGNGYLRIIKLQSSVSATSGSTITTDISANLAGLITVTDGDLRVTIDGTDYDLTGLDFTNASSLAEIATILQRSLPDVILLATSTTIKFTSKAVGSSSAVVIAQNPTGTGTDLSGASYFNTAASTPTAGTNSSGETLVEALTRTVDISYTGVITNLEIEDAVFATTATAIQATNKIFVHHFCSTTDNAGAITTNTNATNNRTRCLLYTVDRATANLMKAADASRNFSTNFSGSRTAGTMNLKPLVGIEPDPGITQTVWNASEVAGSDLYVSYGGAPSVVSNGANLYADQIYARTALKYALETAGFNYLRETDTKIPQTEEGMTGLKNAYITELIRFVRNGYIGVGLTWNSGETFGNPEDLRRNVTDHGYYVYSLPIAQQAQAQRTARIAPLVQIAVKESGAFHKSDVTVIVEA